MPFIGKKLCCGKDSTHKLDLTEEKWHQKAPSGNPYQIELWRCSEGELAQQ